MPPKDANASELFILLSSEARQHRIIDLPRKRPDGTSVGQVAMVALTQEENIIAAAEAERKARKLLKDDIAKKDEVASGYLDAYNNLAAVEVLFLACKRHDDPKRNAFSTPHEISKVFSTDEVGVLYHNYLTVKNELGPIVSTMTEDEFEAWVKLLAEGASAVPLDVLSWASLTTLVRTMASRLHELRTASSSAGSPSEPGKEPIEDSQE